MYSPLNKKVRRPFSGEKRSEEKRLTLARKKKLTVRACFRFGRMVAVVVQVPPLSHIYLSDWVV